MHMEENDPTIKEYQTYKAIYNFTDGLITIDFSPEAIEYNIKNKASYKETLDRINMRIDECFKKSVSHLRSRQSTFEPLK